MTTSLTPREEEVAHRLTTERHRSRQIAADMGLAPATVRYYRQRIYEKLHTNRRADIARILAGEPPPAAAVTVAAGWWYTTTTAFVV